MLKLFLEQYPNLVGYNHDVHDTDWSSANDYLRTREPKLREHDFT